MTPVYTPNLATTGIGSLPFRDGREAAAFVLSAGLDVPFWPQLPRRGFREQMVPQYAEGMPAVTVDAAAATVRFDPAVKYDDLATFLAAYMEEAPARFPISPEAADGLRAFLDVAPRGVCAAVKGQVTGPVTFATGIPGPDGATVYADPDLRDAAVKLLSRKAQWQVELLRPLADRVVIFVDEPVLSAFGSSAYVGVSEADVVELEREVFDAVHAAGGLGGIHVCGNSDWSVILRTGVDVLNFDAYRYGGKLALYASDVAAFLDRGGCIAWGLVPTTADDLHRESCASLVEQFQSHVAALTARGVPADRIRERSLLTPSCGCGSLCVEDAERVFALLAELRDAVRAA